MLTKEQLAARITGREIGEELTPAEEELAKAAGLVIVYGASDDLMEFRGAIEDECGAYHGHTARIDKDGLLPPREEITNDHDLRRYFKREDAGPAVIQALWGRVQDYSWIFETALPHATFEILEDGERYSRGLVFSMADLPV